MSTEFSTEVVDDFIPPEGIEGSDVIEGNDPNLFEEIFNNAYGNDDMPLGTNWLQVSVTSVDVMKKGIDAYIRTIATSGPAAMALKFGGGCNFIVGAGLNVAISLDKEGALQASVTAVGGAALAGGLTALVVHLSGETLAPVAMLVSPIVADLANSIIDIGWDAAEEYYANKKIEISDNFKTIDTDIDIMKSDINLLVECMVDLHPDSILTINFDPDLNGKPENTLLIDTDSGNYTLIDEDGNVVVTGNVDDGPLLLEPVDLPDDPIVSPDDPLTDPDDPDDPDDPAYEWDVRVGR